MKPRAFAAGTTVAPEKSRAEIETTLKRYGAGGFAYASESKSDGSGRARIEFTACARRVRFDLALPAHMDPRFRASSRTYYESKHSAEVRRLWRALLLGIKAKLELSGSGSISTFEAEFMAHIVMPDGRTVGEHVSPRIEQAYASGSHIALLPETT